VLEEEGYVRSRGGNDRQDQPKDHEGMMIPSCPPTGALGMGIR
jgi:hypothetical protein